MSSSFAIITSFSTLYGAALRTKTGACSFVSAPVWLYTLKPGIAFMFHYGVAHDNIDMSSDIVHYPGRCIIRFMPSYGWFQYSRVLYHDYEAVGGAGMLSASH